MPEKPYISRFFGLFLILYDNEKQHSRHEKGHFSALPGGNVIFLVIVKFGHIVEIMVFR